MLVSVIIPSFNCQNFIVETIKSALDQQCGGVLEVIVVDDHSTDHTQQILTAAFGNQITYLQSHGKKNVAAARNTGARIAKGKFLAFLDADDVWLPGKLAKQIAVLNNNEKLSMVASNFAAIGDIDFAFNPLNRMIANDYRDFKYQEIILKNPVVTSSALIRRSDFEKVGGFDEDPRFMFMEDWDLWLRLSYLCGKVRILKESLVQYRVYLNKNRDFTPIYKNAFALLEKHKRLGFLKGFNTLKSKANCHVNLGRAELTKNNRKSAFKHLFIGAMFSTGVQNKARSIVGLMLLFFPNKLQLKLAYSLIVLRNKFFQF